MTAQSGSDGAFRQYLPEQNQPRFQNMKKQDSYEYADIFKKEGQPPWLHGLYLHWRDLFKEPYKGITNDGKVFSRLIGSHGYLLMQRRYCKRRPL